MAITDIASIKRMKRTKTSNVMEHPIFKDLLEDLRSNTK